MTDCLLKTRLVCMSALLWLGLVPAMLEAQPLTLEQSIKIALDNNPKVHVARENVRKSGATVREAYAVGMPKLTIDGTYQRLDKVPEVSFGPGAPSVPIGSLNNRSADLTLTQPLDVFGAIKTGNKAAKFTKSASAYALDQVTNDVTLEAKVAFFAVLRAQKFLKVQESTVAVLEEHLKQAQMRYSAGTIAKFDVLRAETELANARQALISAQNNVELAKAAFNNVLGLPLDSPVELAEPEMPGFVDLDLAVCTEAACKWRPEVMLADTNVKMSDEYAKATELSGKPRFNLRWALNRNLDTTLLNPRESSWRAFLTVSYSIFDGGANKAAVDKAESDAKNARSALELAKDGVILDAKRAYLNVKESRERIAAAEKALEQARESMRLAQVRYAAGVSIQTEVFDAQNALSLAETNALNARYDYQTALANLEHAVGGPEYLAKLMAEADKPVTTASNSPVTN